MVSWSFPEGFVIKRGDRIPIQGAVSLGAHTISISDRLRANSDWEYRCVCPEKKYCYKARASPLVNIVPLKRIRAEGAIPSLKFKISRVHHVLNDVEKIFWTKCRYRIDNIREFEFEVWICIYSRWIIFIYDRFNIFLNVFFFFFFFRLIRIGNWKIFERIERIRNLRNIRRLNDFWVIQFFDNLKKLLKIGYKIGGRNKETRFTVHRIYCLPSYLDRTENLHNILVNIFPS